MSVKRYDERQLRDCDGDWFSTGMKEAKCGRYTLSSDYDELRNRAKQFIADLSNVVELDFMNQKTLIHILAETALKELL